MADNDKTTIEPVRQQTAVGASTLTSVKPGWKTTEFWLAAFTFVYAVGDAVFRYLSEYNQPTAWGVLAAAVTAAGYAVSRARAKTTPTS